MAKKAPKPETSPILIIRFDHIENSGQWPVIGKVPKKPRIQPFSVFTGAAAE
jgi:hypothetical protein